MTSRSRLNLAALVLASAVHFGTRENAYEPGDEHELLKVLDPKGAADLVQLAVIPAAVLGDPDALPGRAAFETLTHDALELLALEHDVAPMPIEHGDIVTTRDIVDALLVAGVEPPTIAVPDEAPADAPPTPPPNAD